MSRFISINFECEKCQNDLYCETEGVCSKHISLDAQSPPAPSAPPSPFFSRPRPQPLSLSSPRRVDDRSRHCMQPPSSLWCVLTTKPASRQPSQFCKLIQSIDAVVSSRPPGRRDLWLAAPVARTDAAPLHRFCSRSIPT
ncbi:hypothetical protein DAI22_02g167900 [Oryza sativa Japonica Group]|nr:hypothetical protein DAI22_02g167900 [Oryza sativa Japonica Group]